MSHLKFLLQQDVRLFGVNRNVPRCIYLSHGASNVFNTVQCTGLSGHPSAAVFHKALIKPREFASALVLTINMLACYSS